MRRLLRLSARAHVWLYRATGGRIGGRVRGSRILLLTTVGRRSGRKHTLPIAYAESDDEILIAAANLGTDRNPGWFWNLRADPSVRIERGGRDCLATARILPPEERWRMWPHLTDRLPALAEYQDRTQRTIPVIALSRRESRRTEDGRKPTADRLP